ncbi:EEIG1/EHBP1 N-terminal domain-containing protein [Heracleum sosnowskyi]|uniref:EEIG1/EHBP1 N-terminal domain-containing protein n=1 Tax=Heracleum sosnowskyi TaxID=360622 RepID=A0AAD8N3I9_9APIA|nr:EEIG1/EHBP1 N-terminal domain-containing protein [Heracleum sosnowskyi]
MMVWSPWSLAATASCRKFRVKVKPLKLQGLDNDFWSEKVMMVGVSWKGEGKFVLPFSSRSRRRKDFSSERILKMGRSWLEWNDQEFENLIGLTHGHKWDVSFSILYRDAKGKMVVTGKGCLNLAKLAAEREFQLERKILINLKAAEFRTESTLSVLVSFAEIRNSHDSREFIAPNIPQIRDQLVNERGQSRISDQNARRAQSARFDSESLESRLSLPGSRTQLDQAKKAPVFSWKRLKSKVERLNDHKTSKDADGVHVDQQLTSSPTEENVDTNEHSKQECQSQNLSAGKWHEMDLVSRDGQTKLVTQVFLASFDQCSCKAAGTEFDSLIIDGSSEWRKLCDNQPLVNNFPDRHFDLETVLETGIRPVLISQEKSFVGFFSPEKFESLKGAMSFDEIWNEIGRMEEENQPRTYIVSWNDHFFVFKVDNEAYYIIDTLGERLYEGCKQAFILKFDKSTSMLGRLGKENVHTEETTGTDDEVICKGKDCCREFIRMFLAAIPLQELELEEEKETVSYYSLHQRLQIEFNFITLSSPSSPSLSSQSSDATVSASSLFSNKNDSE